MADSPAQIAQDPTAPAAERYDAEAELAKSHLHDQLFGNQELRATISQIQEMFHEQDMLKASGQNLIVGPWSGSAKRKSKREPESIFLDDMQVTLQNGGYWERAGVLSFSGMRGMVEQTPILNSIILTRQRQVMSFCRPRMGDTGRGFSIKHVDQNHENTDADNAAIQLLQKFIVNCGWEFDPRRRKQLRRDNFGQFMGKSIRDTLIMDSAPIETVWKNDPTLGIDGFYAVDGATIRLCTELGYDGDDEIFALQVIEGNVRTAYTYQQLIYEVRNPRTDVLASGYGYSETEMLIRVVTMLLNTMTYNANFFDKNSIPRGLLHLSGNYTQDDIASFKRQWNAMQRGVQNSHNMPVMISKDQESKAEFSEIGGQMTEMAFGKWMSFLCAVACAIYGTAPEDVNLESFATSSKGLGGADTEEKISGSNDKGLKPLLGHYENLISDFVIQPFSEDLMFRFDGQEAEDAEQAFESRKLATTWNEFRKESGLDAIEGPIGDAPMNPSFIPIWQAESGVGQPQQDFGDPDAEEGDFGNGAPGDGQAANPDNDEPNPAPAAAGGPSDADGDGYGELPERTVAKSLAGDFGFPILKIEV